MLSALINKPINLEEKISLISQKFSCDILILSGVNIVALANHSVHSLYKVLEPFVDQALFVFELDFPVLLGKVIGEVLVYLCTNQFLCFQNSFVYRIKECDEHVQVCGSIEKLIPLIYVFRAHIAGLNVLILFKICTL